MKNFFAANGLSPSLRCVKSSIPITHFTLFRFSPLRFVPSFVHKVNLQTNVPKSTFTQPNWFNKLNSNNKFSFVCAWWSESLESSTFCYTFDIIKHSNKIFISLTSVSQVATVFSVYLSLFLFLVWLHTGQFIVKGLKYLLCCAAVTGPTTLQLAYSMAWLYTSVGSDFGVFFEGSNLSWHQKLTTNIYILFIHKGRALHPIVKSINHHQFFSEISPSMVVIEAKK